jgi:hypothetical protein
MGHTLEGPFGKGGMRLHEVELEAERVVASPAVTHLRFRVAR